MARSGKETKLNELGGGGAERDGGKEKAGIEMWECMHSYLFSFSLSSFFTFHCPRTVAFIPGLAVSSSLIMLSLASC